MYYRLSFLFVGVLLVSCMPTQKAVSVPEGWTLVEGETFAFPVPSDWSLEREDTMRQPGEGDPALFTKVTLMPQEEGTRLTFEALMNPYLDRGSLGIEVVGTGSIASNGLHWHMAYFQSICAGDWSGDFAPYCDPSGSEYSPEHASLRAAYATTEEQDDRYIYHFELHTHEEDEAEMRRILETIISHFVS